MKTKYTLKIKQILIAFLILFTALNTRAQDKEETNKNNHELKINIIALLGISELSYEYLIDDNHAVGVSLTIPLSHSYDFNFQITPNYRKYYGEKRAAGFFIEGNSAFFSQKERKATIISNEAKAGLGFGLGVAAGAKFLIQKNFIAEIYIGAGANIIGNAYLFGMYPRAGISIGKRF